MLVRVLPEVAARISEPLAKTERMVIINSGNGPGGGASKLTGDVTQIISQLPPVLESLTGLRFEKLLEQVPALRKAMGREAVPGEKKASGAEPTRADSTAPGHGSGLPKT
jgi:flotillin